MTDEEKKAITLFSVWARQGDIEKQLSRVDSKVDKIIDQLTDDSITPGLATFVKDTRKMVSACQSDVTRLEIAFVALFGILSGLGILTGVGLIKP